MAFIYYADIYCDDCGQSIRDRLTEEGKAPDDPNNERSYDSNEYPKQVDDDSESDTPQHCGSHEHCLNAIEIEGGKVGFLFGELTHDGVDYVEEAIIDTNHSGTSWCKEVVELWHHHYSDRGYTFRISPNWI